MVYAGRDRRGNCLGLLSCVKYLNRIKYNIMSSLQIEDNYSYEGMFQKEDIDFCSSLPNQNSKAKAIANAPRRSRSTSDLLQAQQESQSDSQDTEVNLTISLLAQLRRIVNIKRGTKSYLTIPLLNEANEIMDLIESDINVLISQSSLKPNGVTEAQASATFLTKAISPEQADATIQTTPSISRSGPKTTKKSFADALKSNPPKQRPTAILLYPKEKDSLEGSMRDFLSDEVPPNHSIFKNVRKIKNIKNNGLAVIVNNKSQQQEFLEEIQNFPLIKTKISPSLPSIKHPSAILYGVPNSIIEEEIQRELKAATSQDSNLRVRFKFKGKEEDTTNWVFETPGEILKILKRKSKIHVKWHTVDIREFYHIKKCNFCQAYGHVTKTCPNTKPTCGNCTGPHATFKCRRNVFICINCSTYNKVHQTNYSTFHRAHSSACFCHSTEVAAYKRTRDYE
ncbi:hypothetical protein AVEN_236860-1 [Araneus ventricosus]|uniref:CCHC-type domain-containing protein n=1 Tax=Araneus ventricosus TaxID=182803 RepID=A0A4Y2LVD4_ARAVE|nr:hypothetical protein AVEN_236860-1 [Araneus ventricosus]